MGRGNQKQRQREQNAALCSILRLFLGKSYKKRNTGGCYSPRFHPNTNREGENQMATGSVGARGLVKKSLQSGVATDGTQGLQPFVLVFEISVRVAIILILRLVFSELKPYLLIQ